MCLIFHGNTSIKDVLNISESFYDISTFNIQVVVFWYVFAYMVVINVGGSYLPESLRKRDRIKRHGSYIMGVNTVLIVCDKRHKHLS